MSRLPSPANSIEPRRSWTMFKILLRMIGAPVAKRARRLAHDFLGQTLRAPDIQRELLLRRIAQHADSQFGRDHHFREIRTPADFRHRVPLGTYDRHLPYIERV